jgi:acyl-CoA-binding protein
VSDADSQLQARFDSAVAQSKNLSERPDNASLLQLYALFKQASEGDVRDPQPGAMDFVAAAKWNARDALRGVDRSEAMRRYVELVERLAG